MKKAFAGLTAALALLVLAACNPPYTGNLNGPKVAIVGDSITNLTNPAFHTTLDGAYQVSVNGVNSKTVAEQTPAIDEYAKNPNGAPQVAVINLGTNDAIQGKTVLDTALHLLYAASLLPPSTCVVFTTINEHTGEPAWNEFARQLNDGIRQGPHVVDWSALTVDPTLTYDTVHPTATGMTALAAITAEQVQRCGGTGNV